MTTTHVHNDLRLNFLLGVCRYVHKRHCGVVLNKEGSADDGCMVWEFNISADEWLIIRAMYIQFKDDPRELVSWRIRKHAHRLLLFIIVYVEHWITPDPHQEYFIFNEAQAFDTAVLESNMRLIKSAGVLNIFKGHSK